MEEKYKLYHGDCLEILPTLGDLSVTAVMTDFPYGEVNRKGVLRNLDKGVADIVNFEINDLLFHLYRICSGSFYAFCGWRQLADCRDYFLEKGCTVRLIIWEKTNPSPMNGDYVWLSGVETCFYAKKSGAIFNDRVRNTVFRMPKGENKNHPTEKPVGLMGRFVHVSSSLGDVVIDPFMGSGSTGVACMQQGRKFIGIEQKKEYFDIAQERIYKASLQSPMFIEQDKSKKIKAKSMSMF